MAYDKAFIGLLAERGTNEVAEETVRLYDEDGHLLTDEKNRPKLDTRPVARRVRHNHREGAIRRLRKQIPDRYKVLLLGPEGEEPALEAGVD